MPPKRTIRNYFLRLHQSEAVNIKTVVYEGEVGGGADKNVEGEVDKNRMSILFSAPTFYFAPPPLHKL